MRLAKYVIFSFSFIGVREFLEKLHRATLKKIEKGPTNTGGSSVDPLNKHLYSKMAHVNH